MIKQRYEIKNLEIHVSHGCNLTCTSCAHYSNQGHKGMLSLKTAEIWMNNWSSKLKPLYFSLLGGEPTLNKSLVEIVYLTKKMWPDSNLRLTTNGFFYTFTQNSLKHYLQPILD